MSIRSAAPRWLTTFSATRAYFEILKNGYDYLQQTQVYATGTYGPNERFMAPDGSLGRALDTRSDTAEVVCGSWAGFKMARYLMRFTGEARYGDWMERLFYNGVGAALPLMGRGRNFYYGDYRVGGGMKVYNWDTFTCCSGTYSQNIADYYNLAYYKDADSLYVNLYMPADVAWERPEGKVVVEQETQYPEAETSTLTIKPAKPVAIRVEAARAVMDARHDRPHQRRAGVRRVQARHLGDRRTHLEPWRSRRRDDPADAAHGSRRPSASRSRRRDARTGGPHPRRRLSLGDIPAAGAR